MTRVVVFQGKVYPPPSFRERVEAMTLPSYWCVECKQQRTDSCGFWGCALRCLDLEDDKAMLSKEQVERALGDDDLLHSMAEPLAHTCLALFDERERLRNALENARDYIFDDSSDFSVNAIWEQIDAALTEPTP